MFLDPEPKRRKTSRDMSPGFFSSQRPIASTRDPARAIWRQALHERTNSQNNQQQQQGSSHNPGQPTVRLVNPSPSPPTQHASLSEQVADDDAKENWQEHSDAATTRLSQSDWADETSVSESGISARTVSESLDWASKAHNTNRAPSITLLPSTSSVHELPPPTWHRRSTSSGAYSQSSTLHGSDLAISKKSFKSERYSNISQISTLRGTPSPYEQEHKARIEAERQAGSGSAQALQTLPEASPERPERLTTIRPVPPSESSSSTGQGPGSDSAGTSPARPRTTPSDRKQTPSTPPPPRNRSRRTYSTGSIQPVRSRANTQSSLATLSSNSLGRPGSQAISELTFPQASSPNFIAYSPDSARPISRQNPLRSAPSIDSIHSRLQYGSFANPGTGRALANSNSWASLRSNDTLPPLQVPKKRLRHKTKSESLASLASSSNATEMMEEEDIDTQPFPKRPFSSHLSTIASESDHSRSFSQHLSHFSLGSGVLTGDDASSLPLSPIHNRRSSEPVVSIASSLRSPGTRGTTSSEFVDEAGDMTLGIFREESAIPQPLFRVSQAQLLDTSRKYESTLPPLPPIPRNRDSDEHFDTLSALQAPPLRQQKSGRSLRRRSNSTPGHSRQQSQVSTVDSARFSQGSGVFPVWARRFYSGSADLRSKISLSSLSDSGRRPPNHRRNQSSYTNRSITSRLGTGMDDGDSGSPTSSHFLPSIFRPRTRTHKREGSLGSRSSKLRKARRSRPSQESSGSMAIETIPPLPADAANLNTEFLPSGQPRWGTLKGSTTSPSPETQRRLPKKYSKQHLWDQMEFPRPMTKDRLSDFSYNIQQEPHLGPSKRHSQRLGWTAPSFVSSLDTLVTSKHNRQVLCFLLGFVCPLVWMLGAVLPLPKRPISADELEKSVAGSEEDVQAAMVKHEAGDAERRWREEMQFLKGRWWRMLNRIMSVVGVLVIGAVIALAVVATT